MRGVESCATLAFDNEIDAHTMFKVSLDDRGVM